MCINWLSVDRVLKDRVTFLNCALNQRYWMLRPFGEKYFLKQFLSSLSITTSLTRQLIPSVVATGTEPFQVNLSLKSKNFNMFFQFLCVFDLMNLCWLKAKPWLPCLKNLIQCDVFLKRCTYSRIHIGVKVDFPTKTDCPTVIRTNALLNADQQESGLPL